MGVGGFDSHCVQMGEQKRAGKHKVSGWETGQKSQLIRDCSKCHKTNEQARPKNERTQYVLWWQVLHLTIFT